LHGLLHNVYSALFEMWGSDSLWYFVFSAEMFARLASYPEAHDWELGPIVTRWQRIAGRVEAIHGGQPTLSRLGFFSANGHRLLDPRCPPRRSSPGTRQAGGIVQVCEPTVSNGFGEASGYAPPVS
jgi:hypothetical protein